MLSPAETGPVLITGCSRGLGEASARLFQAAGYRTVATSRRGTDIEELRDARLRHPCGWTSPTRRRVARRSRPYSRADQPRPYAGLYGGRPHDPANPVL